jgi:hypothetical protein
MQNPVDFGEIKPVDVKSIWANEASAFTPWLAEHLDRLGEAVGMELELVEREAAIGGFFLDIKAREVGTGRIVVLENQLTGTDHDHLGKLLTYASGSDATVIIWLSTNLREEHQKALEWLNEKTQVDVGFFGVVVEVFRVDASRPALNFKVLVSPTYKWQQEIPERETTPRGEAYKAYFQSLIDELRSKYKFTNATAGQPQNWYSFSSGVPGIRLNNTFASGGRVSAEFYIERNKAWFDGLYAKRHEIDEKFGLGLTWERLDGRQASRIAVYREGSIVASPEELAEIREWSVKTLLRLKEILMPHARKVIEAHDPTAEANAPLSR